MNVHILLISKLNLNFCEQQNWLSICKFVSLLPNFANVKIDTLVLLLKQPPYEHQNRALFLAISKCSLLISKITHSLKKLKSNVANFKRTTAPRILACIKIDFLILRISWRNPNFVVFKINSLFSRTWKPTPTFSNLKWILICKISNGSHTSEYSEVRSFILHFIHF